MRLELILHFKKIIMNIKNLILKTALIVVAVTLTLTSCTDDTPKGEYEDGIFITNEGTSNTGSVSFYSYGGDKVINDVFQTKNERALGTFVQSIKIFGDEAYIVVNGSDKVEIANKSTMEEQAVIEGVSSPRYLVAQGNKGYVSCWGDNSVKVVDLDSYTVTKSISVASGPERMHIKNNKLYVLNSGGWSYDSILTVINLQTEEIESNIKVPDSPIDIIEDNEGNLWILGKGKQVYNDAYELIDSSASTISKFNPETNQIELTINLFEDMHPTCLEVDKSGENMFFGGGYGFPGIFKMEIGTTSATQITDVFAYGFNVDPKSNVIFAGVAPDFTKSGSLIRMDLEGTQLGEYTVGIGPNGTSLKKAK